MGFGRRAKVDWNPSIQLYKRTINDEQPSPAHDSKRRKLEGTQYTGMDSERMHCIEEQSLEKRCRTSLSMDCSKRP